MRIVLLFIISNICYATAADNLACCPSGYFVSAKKHICWNNDGSTVQLRLDCNRTNHLLNFNITSEQEVSIKMTELHTILIGPERACVGNLTSKSKPQTLRPIALICFTEEEKKVIDDKVLGYCMAVSVFFLALTVIVYCILSELRDLMGKSIINFCGSLGIGLGILSIMYTLSSYEDMDLCATRGFLTYFFLIAAFFWMTAISVQVLISTRQPAITDGGWKEFMWYALFAWGCPLVLTVIMAIINFHPGSHMRPGIGLNHCWFFNKQQQWIYMYSVMSILIAVNIAIFIYTSTIVWRHTFASSHVKALRYKFITTVRLIVLMGLPWIFEMIGSLAERHIIWAILDVFNTLQGILIFLLLVVFRKKVIKAMYKRGWLDCMSGIVEKYLAAGEDVEENAIQHTDVPLNDRLYNN